MIEVPLQADAILVDAVRVIEASRRRIAVVVDAQGSLIGTLTDGDVRRCLLAGGNLKTPVVDVMNKQPLAAKQASSSSDLLELMRLRNVMAVPLVDSAGHYLRVVHLSDLASSAVAASAAGFAFAVIMAGGEGARLRPLTQSLPKPLVEIAGVPLLERQLARLAEAHLRRVYISVNYLSHMIEERIGDGARFGIEVRYLHEQEKMGTAGALSLLPERPAASVLVLNGDVLTTSNFGSLHAFHEAQAAVVTAAAIDYRVEIPYGVLKTDGPYATELTEKPSQRFLCNAGIYAVRPDALDLLTPAKPASMTDLIKDCLRARKPVAVFPLHEYWSDIGTPDDLAKARQFFEAGMKHG